jgi:hypothetical protein
VIVVESVVTDVTTGSETVTVEAVTPKHEQALLYREASWQALA